MAETIKTMTNSRHAIHTSITKAIASATTVRAAASEPVVGRGCGR
ncbi:hypothetical protein ACTMTJ_12190 [Phytohabitans sp. LJ34]